MNRRQSLRNAQEKAAQKAAEKQTYFILDRKAEQIAGAPVTAKMRKDGIQLTAEEAAYYIAAGTIGTENPDGSKAAQDAVADANGGGVELDRTPKGSNPDVGAATPTRAVRK